MECHTGTGPIGNQTEKDAKSGELVLVAFLCFKVEE